MSDDESHIDYDEPRSGTQNAMQIDEGEREIIIPWRELSAGALRGVIEEFVTREGTEYGEHEVDLETKVRAVRSQLERGEVVVVFDAQAESVNLVNQRELRNR